MVDAFVDREPRPRERGTTRLAKVSPRRNRGSACGRGCRRKGSSRRLAAICGRSDHEIGGDRYLSSGARDHVWIAARAAMADCR